MRVMILAAGKGTRLRPFTDTMPKALVPVDKEPMISRLISHLKKQGATEIIVNVHHFSEMLIDYLHKHEWGVPIRISDETNMLLDTGGGIKQARFLCKSSTFPLLVHNVDIISNADLKTFYKNSLNNDATLLVSKRVTTRYLLFNNENKLVGWTNIKTGEVKSPYTHLIPDSPTFCPQALNALHRYAFSGIHCIAPSLFDSMDEFPKSFSIIDFYLSVCANKNICAINDPALTLLDLGKPETLGKAKSFLNTL